MEDIIDDREQYNQRNLNNYYSMSAHFAIAVFVCVDFSFNLDYVFEFVCVCSQIPIFSTYFFSL